MANREKQRRAGIRVSNRNAPRGELKLVQMGALKFLESQDSDY